MTDVAVSMNSASSPASASVSYNKIPIVGRIDHVRSFNGSFDTLVLIPARDEYSKPAACVIRSQRRIGSKGEDVRLICYMDGFPRSYTDDKTGEVVRTATTWFVPVNE